MINQEFLKEIGLTKSEIKVYIALLKIGAFSSKGKIIEESKIASSKIYEVLNKLIEKGLVSTIIKNNIKHFAACSPNRIKDFLARKKEKISEEEENINKILPFLLESYKSLKQQTKAELFIGWNGLETVYSTILKEIKPKQEVYIMGASKGENEEKTKEFFSKYSSRARENKIKVKIIFNEDSRNYVKSVENELKVRFNKRFLFKNSPVEIAFTKNVSAIIILKQEPIAIIIYDKQTSEGFTTYFNELWKIAKK